MKQLKIIKIITSSIEDSYIMINLHNVNPRGLKGLVAPSTNTFLSPFAQ